MMLILMMMIVKISRKKIIQISLQHVMVLDILVVWESGAAHYAKRNKEKSFSLSTVLVYALSKGISNTNSFFNHPFTMIVAAPTRSGKTNWVTRLLKNRLKQIKPIPSRIIWFYMHWQPMYDKLKRIIPDEIQWGDVLPTAETFKTYTNSLIILDDMMDDIVNDWEMMKIFKKVVAI